MLVRFTCVLIPINRTQDRQGVIGSASAGHCHPLTRVDSSQRDESYLE
jgi:hypothetical protein